MQIKQLTGKGHSVEPSAKNFVVTQVAKAHFLEHICGLLDEDMQYDEALSYFLSEQMASKRKKDSDTDFEGLKIKAFCYATRLFTGISDNDWLVVSQTIDRYNLPLTISSVKKAYVKAYNQASHLAPKYEPTTC